MSSGSGSGSAGEEARVSASTADLPGLLVAWAGIVGVNMAYALRGRRRHG